MTTSYDDPRTGQFRVPGEGAMLRRLARRGIVRARRPGSPIPGYRVRTENPSFDVVKSPRYLPIPRVTPLRGKQ
jgi:hypothetical protein